MTFDEVLDQVRELLQQRGRVTYRSLKLRYQLDDEVLAGVTDELIKAERVAIKEDGDVLVWAGASPVPSTKFQVSSPTQPLTPNPQPPSEGRSRGVFSESYRSCSTPTSQVPGATRYYEPRASVAAAG